MKSKSLVISAHQPNFMPYLGFFDKMQKSDAFVLITNLQFERHEGWQQRNKIPGPNKDIWLTIPVFGSQNQNLKDVKIDNHNNWCKKQKRTFQLNYSKCKEVDLLPRIEEIYNSKPERLVDINIQFIKLIKEALDIPTKLIVDEDVSGNKHELLVNICKKYNATTYLSGNGAKNYMTSNYFSELEKNSISHYFIENELAAKHPYSTLHYILTEGRNAVIQKINGNGDYKKPI